MHMHTMDQLLTRVVERKGYAVQGADREALLARKGEETLLAAWRTDGPVTAADAHAFLAAYEQVQATAGLLVAPRGIEAAAREVAQAKKGVEVWVESRVTIEVGEAVVKDACGVPGVPAAPVPAPAAAPAAAPAPAQAPPRGSGRFPSLIATAASLSSPDRGGIVTYIPNKPRTREGGTTAEIAQKNNVLGYAWGGAASTGSTPRGFAEVRNGRRRAAPEPAAGTPVPSAAPASGIIEASDDVELVTTPRKPARRQAAAAAAAPAAPVQAPPKRLPQESDDYEIVSTKKPAARAPAPDASGVSTAPAAEGADGQSADCSTLRLRVTREEALARAGAGDGVVVKLALVPHVAFAFDLRMEREGMPAPVAARGAVLASSLTGELRTVDALDFAPAEPADARKDVEKLHAVDVYDKVKSLLAKTYGKTMPVEKEIAGNTVMQTVKLVPDVDEMGLDHKGIVHLPVWEVTGGGANARIDAYTGATL